MSKNPVDATLPCNFRRSANCAECVQEGRLMCHYDVRDTVKFFLSTG